MRALSDILAATARLALQAISETHFGWGIIA